MTYTPPYDPSTSPRNYYAEALVIKAVAITKVTEAQHALIDAFTGYKNTSLALRRLDDSNKELDLIDRMVKELGAQEFYPKGAV